MRDRLRLPRGLRPKTFFKAKCDFECQGICCKNGGGDACVSACSCPADLCPKGLLQARCDTECLTSAAEWWWVCLRGRFRLPRRQLDAHLLGAVFGTPPVLHQV